MRLFFLFILSILFVPPVAGEVNESPQGTLMITYQTDSSGERLTLIHFWLVNEKNERTLYPQKDEAVSSHCSMNERTVVIPSLPVGRYKIEFLIPNKDHYFEEISPREIVLEADQIVKIDQVIPVRPILVPSASDLNRSPSHSKETLELAQLALDPPYPLPPSRGIYPPRPLPFFQRPRPLGKPMGAATFSLKSNEPAGWKLILRGRVVYSGVGSLSNIYLPPGRHYLLLTEPIPGYTVHTAPRSPFDLFPNQIMTMEVFYQRQFPPFLRIEEEEAPRPHPPSAVAPLPLPKEKEEPAPPLKGRLRVLTNSSQALFTLKTETETIIGKGQGNLYLFNDLTPGYYLLDFSNADKSLSPFSSREQIEIAPNQTKEVKMLYRRGERSPPPSSQPIAPSNQVPPTQRTAAPLVQERFLEVPAGIAIIGDPFPDKSQNEKSARQEDLPFFSIGAYEVTNAQYAHWLTQGLREKRVKWDPSRPGHLLDVEGRLLCKTVEGNPLAHLIAQGHPPTHVIPIPGKENHPVIEVTWQGAMAYGQDQGARLPTEAEWEKAAGMSFPKEGKPERFKYGFGRNEIDRTWANYRDRVESRERQQVLTTPVGFYNGVNTLPLRAADRQPLQTHDATSPIGAYDMSGNVWEWVSDHSSDSYVVKGGCYDSLKEEVRVSARRILPPDYSDIYTGFRVAK